jgi:endonuclease YncB( thermonuclease family)
MRESSEQVREPVSPLRAALLAAILSVLAPAKGMAETVLPDCHDIHSNPPESVRLNDGESATVVCIVDGDTFDARLDDGRMVRLRIWGVDCPESRENKKCMENGEAACQSEIQRGKMAKELARMKLKGKKIKIEGPFKDNGQRKLAYVRVQDEDLGFWLIGSCKCEAEYQHARKKEYQKEYKNACGKK